LFGQLRIQIDVVALLLRYVILGKNCIDRTFGDAQCAIDALIRIDGKEILAFAKCVHRAYVDTIRVFAFDAGIDHHIGHGDSPINSNSP
jgi:hypothetical protein